MSIDNVTGRVDPLKLASEFAQSVNMYDSTWLIVTIFIVIVLYKMMILSTRQMKAGWAYVGLWTLSILGWAFYMYISMFEKIKPGGWPALGFVVLSALLIYISFYLVQRKVGDGEIKARRLLKISSAIMIGATVFGGLSLFGSNKTEWGLAVLMGSILGFLIALVYYNYKRMINDENDDKTISYPI